MNAWGEKRSKEEDSANEFHNLDRDVEEMLERAREFGSSVFVRRQSTFLDFSWGLETSSTVSTDVSRASNGSLPNTEQE